MSVRQFLAGEIPLWFQRACGEPLEFLGCHNLTGVSVPRGDTNPIYCRIGKNKFAIDRTWRGTAGLGSLSMTAYDTIMNQLQEMPCAFNLYAMHSIGGSDTDFTNYSYFYLYDGVEVTSEDTDPHSIGQSPDDQGVVMLTMPGSFKSRLKVKSLTAQQISLSLLTTDDLNSITFLDVAECDILGNLSTLGCKVGLITTSGTPAQILRTTDGSTWSVIATPFTDTSQAIGKVIGSGDVVIVLNEEDSSYAYSWDAGLTWTEVTTPTQVLNGAFFISSTNIWFVGDNGYIYQSVNRGSSVILNDAGAAISDTLLDISFADSLLGYAVGQNNAFIKTIDGGVIWSAVAGPSSAAPSANDLYVVTAVAGTDIVFIGDEQGNVYRSPDQGATWTTVLSDSRLIGGIRGIVAPSCNVIAVVGNDQDPYFYTGSDVDGYMFQSIDGGNSWVGINLDTNTGVNDIFDCGLNRYWIPGEAGFLDLVSGLELV